jgi:membrane protease YdiL (CAAX protease family)
MGLMAGLLSGLPMLLDLLPRRRRSGLLEMLRGTTASGRELVLSATVISLAATLLGTLLMALGLTASTVALGRFAWPAFPWALAPAWLGLTAVGMHVFLRITELRAAALSLLAVILGLLGLTMGTLGLADLSPWLAAVVPLGGAIAACMVSLGAGPTALASAVTILASGGLLAWVARSLDHEEHAGGQLAPSLIRRAEGRYGPEVAILFASSLGGFTLVSTALAEQGWPALIAGQAGFLLVPALLTPAALGLPWRELLPLGRPEPRALLATPFLGVGLIGVAGLVGAAWMQVLPVNTKLLELVGGSLSELATGPGVLLIGLVPAVCEEALFRGSIYGLLRRRLGPGAANVVQATLFALVHVYPFRYAHTFVLGLVLGWLRHRTGALWVPALVHLAINSGSALLQLLEVDLAAQPEWLVVMTSGLVALALVPRAFQR